MKMLVWVVIGATIGVGVFVLFVGIASDLEDLQRVAYEKGRLDAVAQTNPERLLHKLDYVPPPIDVLAGPQPAIIEDPPYICERIHRPGAGGEWRCRVDRTRPTEGENDGRDRDPTD